jgi:uncharacterized membrane protein YfcA
LVKILDAGILPFEGSNLCARLKSERDLSLKVWGLEGLSLWKSECGLDNGGMWPYTNAVHDPIAIALAICGVLIIGIAKSGFGGGLGMLTTPLCVVAFGPKDAIGILLPLLCVADGFSLYHYWGKWNVRNVWLIVPGSIVGAIVGVQLIGHASAREMNVAIGVLALLFVAFQLGRNFLKPGGAAYVPKRWHGIGCGLASGVTSTFAHGAGPVVTVFLVPQNLSKELFVGTSILVFAWINWIKIPLYVLSTEMVGWGWLPPKSLINLETLKFSLLFLPVVPVGIWIGLWMNRKFSEKIFLNVIYGITFLTGLKLISNVSVIGD